MGTIFHLEVGADHLATLTFDTPDKKANIFTREALEELERTVAELAGRDDIGCLVLVSAKPGMFIAGADVELIARVSDPEEAEAGVRFGQALFAAWEALPFPTVAAIDGTCVGGGMEIALASSWIVVSDRPELRIGLPEVQLGIVPAWGGCTRLPRRVGAIAALDIILAGKTVPGRRAAKIGLADAIFPSAGFYHHVRDFARARIGAKKRRRRQIQGIPAKSARATGSLRPGEEEDAVADQGQLSRSGRRAAGGRTGLERGRKAGFEAEVRAASGSRPARSPRT
ncbi:MAG: enoyl-CoA hydratase-related protein [Thermoanaerobaculia bacterium]